MRHRLKRLVGNDYKLRLRRNLSQLSRKGPIQSRCTHARVLSFSTTSTVVSNDSAPSNTMKPLSSSPFEPENIREAVVDISKNSNNSFTENDEIYTFKYCPKCPPHKDIRSNLYKLSVWKLRGGFYCQRCLSKGNFIKFKEIFRNFKGDDSIKQLLGDNDRAKREEKEVVSDKNMASIQLILSAAQKTLDNEDDENVANVVATRGITRETLKKFNCGVMNWRFYLDEFTEEMAAGVVYPWYSVVRGQVVLRRFKVRSIKTKSNQILHPKGGSWGLFGYNLITPDDREVVLTEGEYDAMAVHQATGLKALSLPVGCNNLPLELLPLFDQFAKIYVWMDNDINGQESAEKFSRKLGIDRCFVVSTDAESGAAVLKDANEVLLENKDMAIMIRNAKVIPHKQIASFWDLSGEIFREIKSPDATRGVQLITLPCFNQLMKGHRSGELTVFTGQTGIGKTTLLSQISLDLAQQGVNTLWGSFEIKSPRLGKLMMRQFCGFNVENHLDRFDAISERFGTLPLRFLRFFGTTDLDEVIDAMEYAHNVYDVKHIVIDNLQFMMGHSQHFNKFDQQDLAISTLRQFATLKNVHITVVIHPRKEQEGKELGISSIFGSAKASQESDNIVVLENYKGKKYIHMKKNRFSGDLGCVEYEFEKESGLFYTEKSFKNLGKPLGIFKAFKEKIHRSKNGGNGAAEPDDRESGDFGEKSSENGEKIEFSGDRESGDFGEKSSENGEKSEFSEETEADHSDGVFKETKTNAAYGLKRFGEMRKRGGAKTAAKFEIKME